MRFHDALLLQKQQAEHKERQQEAQAKLEEVASRINAQFDYWCQFRDPFGESQERILQLGKSHLEDNAASPETITALGGSSVRTIRQTPAPTSNSTTTTILEPLVRHQDESTDIHPTAFNLYRKLKFG